MKRKDIIRQIIIVLAGAVLTTACSSSDKEEVTPPAKRTVLVYMAAENSLSSYAQQDINEMIKGVKKISKWDHLIVFVDRASKTEKPFLIRLRTSRHHPQIRSGLPGFRPCEDEGGDELGDATLPCQRLRSRYLGTR